MAAYFDMPVTAILASPGSSITWQSVRLGNRDLDPGTWLNLTEQPRTYTEPPRGRFARTIDELVGHLDRPWSRVWRERGGHPAESFAEAWPYGSGAPRQGPWTDIPLGGRGAAYREHRAATLEHATRHHAQAWRAVHRSGRDRGEGSPGQTAGPTHIGPLRLVAPKARAGDETVAERSFPPFSRKGFVRDPCTSARTGPSRSCPRCTRTCRSRRRFFAPGRSRERQVAPIVTPGLCRGPSPLLRSDREGGRADEGDGLENGLRVVFGA